MRKLLFILFAIGAFASAQGQNMRTFFLNAPQEIFPLLTANCRADLVDYIDAEMRASVTNRLDGKSVLEELGNDYLAMASTASSRVEMKLLPCGGDTIVCVVNTVKAEVADSRIAFYDKEWNLLPADDFFTFPAIEEFFVPGSPVVEHIDKCDIYLVSLSLSLDDITLVAEYTMPDYMFIDDAEAVKPLMSRIVYRWNGRCFVIE